MGHSPIGLPTSCGQDGETLGLLISTMCIGKPGSVVSEAVAVEGYQKGRFSLLPHLPHSISTQVSSRGKR